MWAPGHCFAAAQISEHILNLLKANHSHWELHLRQHWILEAQSVVILFAEISTP